MRRAIVHKTIVHFDIAGVSFKQFYATCSILITYKNYEKETELSNKLWRSKDSNFTPSINYLKS